MKIALGRKMEAMTGILTCASGGKAPGLSNTLAPLGIKLLPTQQIIQIGQ
jgi:hypothetical protein